MSPAPQPQAPPAFSPSPFHAGLSSHRPRPGASPTLCPGVLPRWGLGAGARMPEEGSTARPMTSVLPSLSAKAVPHFLLVPKFSCRCPPRKLRLCCLGDTSGGPQPPLMLPIQCPLSDLSDREEVSLMPPRHLCTQTRSPMPLHTDLTATRPHHS